MPHFYLRAPNIFTLVCLMFLYKFDAIKTIQAAAVIVQQSGGEITRLRLLKLLYIADRESIRETGSPISRGPFSALRHGPIHSALFDLIKGKNRPGRTLWLRYFQTEGRNVELIGEPGVGKLTRYQVRKLEETVEEFRHRSDAWLRNYTHKFYEWKANDPGDSSNPIPLEDILVGVDRTEDADQLISMAREEGELDELFAEIEQG